VTSQANDSQIPDVSADLVIGVKNIARVLGTTERQTYHLISRGFLPGAFKIGPRQHAALRSVLLENLRAKAKGAVREAV